MRRQNIPLGNVSITPILIYTLIYTLHFFTLKSKVNSVQMLAVNLQTSTSKRIYVHITYLYFGGEKS